MGDTTIQKIDQFFDVVDATLDEGGRLFDRIIGTGENADHAVKSRRGQPDKKSRVIDVDASSPPPNTKTTPVAKAKSTSKVRIIESIDAETGVMVFVITDGVSRAEAPSRDIADRIKSAMEAG